MTYQEWINATSKTFSIRSRKLKAVDQALKAYSKDGSTVNMVVLKNALGDWQNSKTEWAASQRNSGGAVDRLQAFVQEKMRLVNHSMVLQAAAAAAAKRTAKQEAATHHLSIPVQQVQRRTPPVTYEWNVRMDLIDRGTAVEAVVHIKPSIANKALLPETQRFWKLHIERAWSVATIVDGASKYDLLFRLNFTNAIADAYEVNVANPPPDEAAYLLANSHMDVRDARAQYHSENTPHMGEWARTDSQAVIHEFGHMIGCPDEYWTSSHRGFGHVYDGSIYNNEPFTTPSIMNDTSKNGRIFDRHFLFMRKAYIEWRHPANSVEVKMLRNFGPTAREETQQLLQASLATRRQAMGYDDDD